MGMTEHTQEKGLAEHWLTQRDEGAEIKIKHFHVGKQPLPSGCYCEWEERSAPCPQPACFAQVCKPRVTSEQSQRMWWGGHCPERQLYTGLGSVGDLETRLCVMVWGDLLTGSMVPVSAPYLHTWHSGYPDGSTHCAFPGQGGIDTLGRCVMCTRQRAHMAGRNSREFSKETRKTELLVPSAAIKTRQPRCGEVL